MDTHKLIELIEIVKKYPILYDSSLPDYHNRNKQEKLWLIIANELKIEAAKCKDRWKNLRSGLSRHLRNVHARKTTKPYYLAEYLDFLIPHNKTRKLLLAGNSDVNIVPSEEETDDNREIHDNSNMEYSIDIDNFHSQHEDVANVHQENDEEINSHMNKIINTLRADDPVEKCAMEYFAAKKAKICESYSDDDPDLNFLKSLLPEIKRMNWQQKNQFKIAVLKDIESVLTNNTQKSSTTT